MQRILKIAFAGLIVAMGLLFWLTRGQNPERAESKEISGTPAVLAAQGRVEGREETVSLGSSAEGVVKEVLVQDGQEVTKGSVLAIIDCDDIGAEIELAKAQAESARQARIRLLRGHRDEERKAAAQETAAAKAILTEAQEHLEHSDTLYQQDAISRDVFEEAKRDLEVANANYEKALAEQELVNAQPLPEEIARADSEVVAAERNIAVATDKLEKCTVRAPISGTVLKVMTRAGESYSSLLPHPLLTLADESVRRVRAEVDERDIGKVRLGQTSIVTADGFPGQSFNGRVVQIYAAMKPKSVLSDDPSQKVDRDVLDVIVELEPSAQQLPLGLRVTAQMTGLTSSSAPGSSGISAAPSHVPIAPSATRAIPTSAPGAESKPTGLVLQVGAMTHRENADALVATLRKKGFSAFVLARDGDSFYRVDVGPYPEAADAGTAADELRSAGFGTAIERPYLGSPR